MQIQHPVQRGNKRLWLDPETEAFVDVLNNGHPALGWAGDPQLGLFRLPGQRWEIARLENGRYQTFCISKPGAKLDWSVIIQLQEHDLQRQTAQQLFDAVEKENTRRQKDKDDKAANSIGDALMRAYWHAGKQVL